MSVQMKKFVLWAIAAIPIIIVIKLLSNLFWGLEEYREGPRLYEMGRGHVAGFPHHQFMYGPHYGGEHLFIPIIVFLIIGAAIGVLLLKWMRGKRREQSFEHFTTEIPFSNINVSLHNRNADILDKWEQTQIKEKEENR